MYFKSEDPVWEKAHTPYSYEPFQVVEDLIIHLFPKMKLCKTYDAACEKIVEMEGRVSKNFPASLEKKTTRPDHELLRHLHNIQECDGKLQSFFQFRKSYSDARDSNSKVLLYID